LAVSLLESVILLSVDQISESKVFEKTRDRTIPGSNQSKLIRRSRTDHNQFAAPAAFPRIFLAPLLRFAPNRSRHWANNPSTNARLPITAPSVKYLTFHRSICRKAT
jgi:hypothetical protein